MKLTGVHICILVVLAVLGLIVYGSLRYQGPQAPPEHTAAPEGTQPPVQDAQNAAAPVIELEPAGLIDLGIIPRTAPGKGQIKVHNKGNAILEINDVRASCGCTRATIEDAQKNIPPGGASIIEVAVDPNRVPFVSKKAVFVRSNDPVHPSVTIEVLAHVDPEFEVVPLTPETPKEASAQSPAKEIPEFLLAGPQAKFGKVRKGTVAEQKLVLRQLSDEPVELLKVTSLTKDPNFQYSFVKRPENEWRAANRPEYVVTARLAEDCSLGHISGRFNLETTCKRVTVRNFPCTASAEVVSFYTVSPNRALIVRNGAQANMSNVALATITSPEKPFEITDLNVTNQDLKVVVKPGLPEPGVLKTIEGPARDIKTVTQPASAPNAKTIEVTLSPNATLALQQNDYVRFTVKAADEAVKERIAVRILGEAPPLKSFQRPVITGKQIGQPASLIKPGAKVPAVAVKKTIAPDNPVPAAAAPVDAKPTAQVKSVEKVPAPAAPAPKPATAKLGGAAAPGK